MNTRPYPTARSFILILIGSSAARLSAAAVLFCSLILPSVSAATITKLANTDALDLNSSWSGGAVPGASDIATFDTSWNVATPNTLTIGNGVSFQGIAMTGAPQFVTINAGTGGTLTLGSSGIDLSALANTRTLTISSTITLGADQSWQTGGVLTGTAAQITANGVISGTGKLTIDGSNQGFVQLNGANTFSGGFVLNSGGAVKVGGTTLASGGVVTSGALGKGTVTINGGTIYGGSDTAATSYDISGNFAINNGALGGANARLGFSGALNLNAGTRTVTLGRSTTLANAQVSGNESLRFNTITNGPAISVANGTFRLVGDSSTNGTNSFSVLGINSAMNFTNNAGLTIGQNVITRFGSTDLFGTGSNAPVLTVESGGIFNMGTSTGSASVQVASLNGAGTVANLSATATTRTLTIGANNLSGNFSGKILNGANFAAAFPSVDMTGVTSIGTLAVTKIGTGTQTFSGTGNNYTGATTISAGTLALGANNALSAVSAISVANGAALAMNAFSGSASALTLDGGGKLSFSLGVVDNTTAQLALTNAFTKGAAGTYTFDLSGGVVGTTYKLLSFGSTTFSSGTDFTLLAASGYAGTFVLGANDLSFTVTANAIPEPSAFAALAGAAVLGWVGFRRRRR